MKLICTQENLNRIISYLEKVAGKQSTLPILSNFLLETENGRLKISATNLEIGIIGYIGAKIEKEGKIAIPAKLLSNFIHNLPLGDVLELESDTEGLKIISTAYQTKIKGLDGKDFPIIPEYKEEYFFSFPAQELKRALSRLLFCISVNNARLELTGVHIFFYKDHIELASTDSFRLAEETIPLVVQGSEYDAFLTNNQSLIIPGNTLHEIIHIITPESKDVKIALKENQIFFEIDGVQIISRIINGKYPDYKQIIPKNFQFQAVFEKESLQRALKIASSFSSYNSSEITLHLQSKEKQCVVSSESQEIGTNKAILPIEIIKDNIEPLTIIFNPRYLLEGISALGSEKILFSANDKSTPVELRISDTKNTLLTENYLYIVMPIRK
ncbi:MAG: DNA polymerase III subunit beta [Candidatus Moranbacteria bacterium]|nr:DNA polymerase III subunit beta [Candidatus Moranbacteria bacterium]MDD3964614.1 DNA polymerase III subunit beta [Candidatus Moranbacteria bacterium]